MAQHFIDFSSYSTGSGLPSGWSDKWYVTGDWAIVSDSSFTGDKYLDDSITSGSSIFAASYDTVDGTTDIEVVTKFQVSSSSSDILGPVVWGETHWSPEYNNRAYVASLDLVGSDFTLYSVSGSIQTSLASTSYSASANTFYWVRIRRNGSDLKGKIWQDGNSEPASWTLSTTDTSISSGDAVFNGVTASSSAETDIDVVGFGTNGDTAPKSGGSAPNAPSNLQATVQ